MSDISLVRTHFGDPDPQPNKDDSNFLQKLNSLDFGSLAYKLMNPENSTGMSLEMATDAIKKYKGFLFLIHKSKGQKISPSAYIDHVWHTAVLDTEMYYVQCGVLFGEYIHHFPFFGQRDEQDKMELEMTFENTTKMASSYLSWDFDDWCGTKPGKFWPPKKWFEDLNTIFGHEGEKFGNVKDKVIIKTGGFTHTVEVDMPIHAMKYSFPSDRFGVTSVLKLPKWITVCMPIDILKDISIIRNIEKLLELEAILVKNRLSPREFDNKMVHLELKR
jgi:hypothetical protein